MAIRTAQIQGNWSHLLYVEALLGQPMEEYQETNKNQAVSMARARFELLTTGLIHQGELTFLEQHSDLFERPAVTLLILIMSQT